MRSVTHTNFSCKAGRGGWSREAVTLSAGVLRGQDGGSVHDLYVHTSTLAMRTGFTPRWTAFLGFACALLLLLSGRYIDWIILIFPLWVLLISIYILIDNLRRTSQTATTSPVQTNS